MAKYVAERAAFLKAEPGEPRRLTRTVLISGAPGGRISRSPLVMKALADNVESTRQHRVRCVRWAIENRDSLGPNVHMYIQNRMGRGSGARVSELLARGEYPSEDDMNALHPGPASRVAATRRRLLEDHLV